MSTTAESPLRFSCHTLDKATKAKVRTENGSRNRTFLHLQSLFSLGNYHVPNEKPQSGDPGELLQQPDFPTSGEARPAEEAGGELE